MDYWCHNRGPCFGCRLDLVLQIQIIQTAKLSYRFLEEPWTFFPPLFSFFGVFLEVGEGLETVFYCFFVERKFLLRRLLCCKVCS